MKQLLKIEKSFFLKKKGKNLLFYFIIQLDKPLSLRSRTYLFRRENISLPLISLDKLDESKYFPD